MKIVLERIKQDRKLTQLLMREIINQQGNPEKQEEIFQFLAEQVRCHLLATQRVLYSELMCHDDAQPILRKSAFFHAKIEDLLQELETTVYSDSNWLNKFKSFCTSINSYFKKDGVRILTLAEELLTRLEAAELEKDYVKLSFFQPPTLTLAQTAA